MQFILNGFSELMGFRVFAFEGIAADRTRTPFTVRTDLALSRRYGIRLQELPLLCREVLERRDETEEKRAFTYTEEDMRLYASACAAARDKGSQHRKGFRRPDPDTSHASGEFHTGSAAAQTVLPAPARSIHPSMDPLAGARGSESYAEPRPSGSGSRAKS